MAAFLVLALAMAGCGGRTASPVAEVEARPAAEPLPEVATRVVQVRWQAKARGGDLVPQLEVRAARGRVEPDGLTGDLEQATGTLYRDGEARATFEAPLVTANQAAQQVVASGGVVVRSVRPPGITVRAQTVTWHSSDHRVVARGDVWFEQKPPAARRAVAWGGPFESATLNTQIERLTIP
ncbi:MAG TPA: hypothetical protein VLH79_11555 [Chthonomonadales bacterium]|nr:hypothetical protein [Chthonomonadales bacterium]